MKSETLDQLEYKVRKILLFEKHWSNDFVHQISFSVRISYSSAELRASYGTYYVSDKFYGSYYDIEGDDLVDAFVRLAFKLKDELSKKFDETLTSYFGDNKEENCKLDIFDTSMIRD